MLATAKRFGALIMSDHPLRRDDDSREARITDKTFVQVGSVCAVCVVLMGAIWWASSIHTKMETIIEEMRGNKIVGVKVQEMDSEMKVIHARILALEAQNAARKTP